MENILENKKIKISQIIESYGFKQSNNGFQSQNVNIEFKDNFLTIKDKENVFDQLTIDNFKREHLLDRIGWVIQIPNSFDEVRHAKDHPETEGYYQPWAKQNNIPERRRLFHHYFLYIEHRPVDIDTEAKDANAYNQNKENITVKHSGIHVFAYEDGNVEEAMHRQSLSVQSYCNNKIEQIKILSLAKKDPKIPNTIYHKIEDINYDSVKCERDYYYLGSILKYAISITKKNDYIIYTNSDCHIKNNFYNFILGSDYDCIEFFRADVEGESVVGHNKDGIDGFAIKNKILKKLIDKKILPEDLILGAPYWDAIFSSITRKHVRNKYQDISRLYHTKHKPRWSAAKLDYAGQHNLNILNTLYNNKTINCRKAEIKSDTLVIRIFDENTDFTKIKKHIHEEKFSQNKIKEFDYNYLFIEKISGSSSQQNLNDDSIGTTSGTRYHVRENEIEKILENEKKIYSKHIVLNDDQQLHSFAKFTSNKRDPKLGVVLAVFGQDPLRIEATNKAIIQLKKQSNWNDCQVVFVELLEIDETSVFDFSNEINIIHLKIVKNKFNQNLFQKECLWNIGAKKIIDKVDNIIFIDADTFSQEYSLFSRINRLLYENSNIVYQLGNCIITMRDDSTITRVQWLWSDFAKLKASNPYCFGPCGGFAISKQVFEQINGFNPYGFLYGGDILFIYELDDRTRSIYNWAMKHMKIFQDMPRDIDHDDIVIKNSESPLIHCWHGSHESRPYHIWGMVFNELNFDKKEINIDENGLLAWSGEESFQKYSNFFKNKHKTIDVKDYKRLYS